MKFVKFAIIHKNRSVCNMKITDRFLTEGAAFIISSIKNLLFAQNKFLAEKFNLFLVGGILSGLQVVKNPSKRIFSKI